MRTSEYWTRHPDVVLLQYVDDLMLAATTKEVFLEATGDLLQTLGTLGYWASAKKAQIAKQEVIYLGVQIKTGAKMVDSGYERDYFIDPRANDSSASEGVLTDCWVLQAMDPGVC